MTYRPLVKYEENYEVRLELVQYVDGYRHVHASWTDWVGYGPEPGQKCWVYRKTIGNFGNFPYLTDSEACKLPLELLFIHSIAH